jgi:hypothetical protein
MLEQRRAHAVPATRAIGVTSSSFEPYVKTIPKFTIDDVRKIAGKTALIKLGAVVLSAGGTFLSGRGLPS